jgi:hypothetical protein
LVNGTLSDSINFRGDRLDKDYQTFLQDGPVFISAKAVKKCAHAYQRAKCIPGTRGESACEQWFAEADVECVRNDNAYDAGILCLNSSLKAVNCLVSNCGINILIANGGNYEIDQCLVAAYSNLYLLHKQPAVAMTNWDSADNQLFTYPLSVNFQNSIIWGDNGSVEDEVFVSKKGSIHSL